MPSNIIITAKPYTSAATTTAALGFFATFGGGLQTATEQSRSYKLRLASSADVDYGERGE